jgi:hypothetical protein
MDLLHEQVHNEVYSALSQELVSVAQNLTAIRMEAHNSLEELRNSGTGLENTIELLTTAVERVREDMNSMQKLPDDLKQIRVDVKQLRDKELKQLSDSFQQSLEETEAKVHEDMLGLRAETEAAIQESVAAAPAPSEQLTVPEDFATRVADIEAKIPEIEQAMKDALSAEAAERATRAGELAMSVELSRAEACQSAEHLQTSLQTMADEVAERERQAEQKTKEAQEQAEEQVRQTETLVAEMEKRLGEKGPSIDAEVVAEANEAAKSLETRLSNLSREVELQFDDARKDIRQLTQQCREGLGFAHNCWTRTIDWMASVDLAELDRTGRFDVESPEFMAAGLRDLQLCLRLVSIEKPNGKARWTCGAFLRGSVGQVTFRLHIAGKGMSFAGDFSKTSEWGSQKIVTLESVGASVAVRLEILDVAAEVPAEVDGPSELVSTFQMTDAARVAAREAEKVRSSMVKRIEWRIVHVSERIAAARSAVAAGHAELEALEPLLSPPFSAGGVEGLQLQLYPFGFLRRDDVMPSSNYEEKCSFYLVCPRGVYMKCRAFVGDQVKIFENHYTEREPLGRANFCRLIDKAGNDDSVICGIEILDVRQELTTQVKGGPGGSMVDQMKVTLAPSLGGMEFMRELRDAGERMISKARPRPTADQGYPSPMNAANLTPLGPSMMLSNVQSLPSLRPEAVSAKAAALGRNRRGVDARSGDGSWPPSPSSPQRQRTRLPRI